VDEAMPLFTHVEAVNSWGAPFAGAARAKLTLRRTIKNNPKLLDFLQRARAGVRGRV
jgi:hypothetical protein